MRIDWKIAILLLLCAALLFGCSAQPKADTPDAASASAQKDLSTDGQQVADESQMAPVQQVVNSNMTPIPGDVLQDGQYDITVDSSSTMFSVERCELTVESGSMTAVLHMGGTGYLYVFMGTGEAAAAADTLQYIPFEEQPDGTHTFTVPVEALDQGLACAAFSKKKELWYDRTLVFRSDSLPKEAFLENTYPTADSLGLTDGNYTIEVQLTGGSGRASIQSPAALRIEDGAAYASVIWGSRNYDYMRIGDLIFDPLPDTETSAFEIPVAQFDRTLTVFANTTAMSTPHEIEYSLCFDAASITPAG